MLTTTNYKLKKPELIDSPPDITVTNSNWDLVDLHLKEAQNDGRDWKGFKAVGGIIEGPVTYNGSSGYKLKIDGRTLEAIGEGLQIKAPGAPSLFYYNNPNYSKGALIPEFEQGIMLGQPGNTFSDAWVGKYMHAKTGYTKITNNFLLQWGNIKTATAGPYYIAFPIAFPENCLCIVISRDALTFSNILTQNVINSGFNARIEVGEEYASLSWYAIGH